MLELNLLLNGIETVTVQRAALWQADGEVPFRASWHSTGGAIRAHGQSTVTAVSLDRLLAEYGSIDLLKLDIEGAEGEVLTNTDGLHRIKRIIGELHLQRPGEERPMLRTLREREFTVRLIPAASLYGARHVRAVLANWRALEGQTRIKLGLLAYLLLPVSKPRRPPGSRDMPLLVAERA